MTEGIIVALITGTFAVLGQWLISRQQTAKRRTDEAVRDALQEARLKAIEAKLDIHNGYAERFSEIQTDIAVIKNDVKTLYKRGPEGS